MDGITIYSNSFCCVKILGDDAGRARLIVRLYLLGPRTSVQTIDIIINQYSQAWNWRPRAHVRFFAQVLSAEIIVSMSLTFPSLRLVFILKSKNHFDNYCKKQIV